MGVSSLTVPPGFSTRRANLVLRKARRRSTFQTRTARARLPEAARSLALGKTCRPHASASFSPDLENPEKTPFLTKTTLRRVSKEVPLTLCHHKQRKASILALGSSSHVKRAFAPSAIYRFLMTNFDQRISKGSIFILNVHQLEAPRL